MSEAAATTRPDAREGDPEAAAVAAILRRARRTAGLTLRELARRAGTSHPTVLAYESGAKVPGAATFLRLLEACDHTIELRPSPRVRQRDGIARGDELESVLRLAEQFPVRLARTLRYPRFPA